MNKNLTDTLIRSGLFCTLATFAACAPMAPETVSGKSASSQYSAWSTGTGTNTTTDDDTTGTTRNTGVPPITATVSGTGYSSTTVTVRTHSILKVKFRAGVPGCIPNTNFCPRYSRLGVYVGVGTNTEPTGMISNGFIFPQEESEAINLASKFTHSCSSSDSTCRQSVTIQVEKPNSDFFCLGVSGCWTHVQDGYPWTGTLVIETDDTNSI